MAKIITAKTMGGEWYFGSPSNSGYKVSESSDGKTEEGGSISTGAPQSVPDGMYYSGSGSYWTCSGIPWSSTGMTCGTNTDVGNHFWSTYIFGVDKRNAYARCSNIPHSPVYDNLINRIQFDFEKVDGAKHNDKSHHIRVATLGLMYRTGTNTCGIKSFPCPTNEVLHRFETTYSSSALTKTGSYNKTCSGAYVKYPIGFFVCLEWQGNRTGTALDKVPKVVVKNLRLGVNTTNDPILNKFQTYSSHTPPTDFPMWTK